jgi:hypothetical protein
MADIKVKDLNSIAQDLSENELRLQGGCYKTFAIRLSNGKLTTGKVFCNRVIIN